MKWSSMNNTDILVQVKLAYKLSFVKSPLDSFDNGRELYLEEKKMFRSRYNYNERIASTSYLDLDTHFLK